MPLITDASLIPDVCLTKQFICQSNKETFALEVAIESNIIKITRKVLVLYECSIDPKQIVNLSTNILIFFVMKMPLL